MDELRLAVYLTWPLWAVLIVLFAAIVLAQLVL